MKVIKHMMICLCFFCLCSCSKSMGHFKDGTIQLDQLIQKINEKSIKGDWSFPILNESAVSLSQVAELYEIDMTQIKDSKTHQSLLMAQIGEIAFFHVEESKDTMIKESINKRMDDMKTQWGTLLMDAETLLQDHKEGRIGEYYYVIVGSDAQKVVNYIQNIK